MSSSDSSSGSSFFSSSLVAFGSTHREPQQQQQSSCDNKHARIPAIEQERNSFHFLCPRIRIFGCSCNVKKRLSEEPTFSPFLIDSSWGDNFKAVPLLILVGILSTCRKE
ncbi:hypothetical protein OIU85_017997 [Salix viminalis]|uniref:Uncharacterized protein n=1 Tax=Salix viminalis TaxID=40686 RepID=A0A9Q0ZIH4_SALVM|nr:hypothetical protein OIU85_017997 [Salix viminalis]